MADVPTLPNGIDCREVSLRDWFAGQAMIGLLACSRIHEIPEEEMPRALEMGSRLCFQQADAMLAAREQTTTRKE